MADKQEHCHALHFNSLRLAELVFKFHRSPTSQETQGTPRQCGTTLDREWTERLCHPRPSEAA
jgi:hypothetical protein